MRLGKKWIAGLLALILIVSIVAGGCAATQSNQDTADKENSQQVTEFKPLSTTGKKVVAEYNGGKVTEGELNRYINIIAFLDPQLGLMMSSMKDKQNQLRAELAKEYAARQYMVSKVKDDPKYDKEADQTMSDIENGLKNAPQAEGSKAPKNLADAIKGKGFTKEELQQFFVDYHKVNEYYDEQMKGDKYDWVKAAHILIAVGDGQNQQPKRSDADAKKRAEEVEKKLAAGGDFAKLAKQYSDDPGSKDNGGVIEGSVDQFVPEFSKACKTLPLNTVSDPVKTSYGYHIIKVLDRQQKPIADAPDDVKAQKREEIYNNLVKSDLKFKSLLPA
ncbi:MULTISPECIES: peptidylprolyl isomerase [Thermoactinomyces]|jgi:foldase protein PrsA|uniref:Peptidylprolyl isomerase n=1 Tax=Thermoactinomyces daqus TaxID=1329516 RepID=A0A7W2AGR2_9BACL|nr:MULTISPECIES: peptidylprolyl isomerase [Thermoactinomyces]MBA4542442.1 peptidylprolyl isomerase [Thermoactinomyces daqus]MBH8598769.1 peptidylprolyl isomerase [Thermoactinomyces sp. CICC 10523]MBH8604754.1 peptidylprolyl isomerase [Thermoactinomyces sp. CICC 10522]MBH8607420.1 peptidylprolyl isomerase [Thermoactinomyces sp. CICC 10521]